MTYLIVALDVDTREAAMTTVRRIEACPCFKIGLQLFTRCGPDVVEVVRAAGKQVFLDLKFHDIPNTVAQASRAAAEMGVDFLTLHSAGGRKMISAAREAVERTRTRLLAVTVLTSLDDAAVRDEVGLNESAEDAAVRYAAMAVEAGAHGVVCSPREITRIRAAVGPGALIVVPGVRPIWATQDDQARTMTPREAASAGADYVVVGRPILRHRDPAVAARQVIDDLMG